MTRTKVGADEVRAALAALDYPAGKDEVLAEAERAGAPDDVLRLLRSLALADYDNVDEVVRSLDTVEATGQDPSDEAARQLVRGRGQRLVAEHEHDATAGS